MRLICYKILNPDFKLLKSEVSHILQEENALIDFMAVRESKDIIAKHVMGNLPSKLYNLVNLDGRYVALRGNISSFLVLPQKKYREIFVKYKYLNLHFNLRVLV